MREIITCTTAHYAQLSEVWERSVRATHHFLTENDIEAIKRSLEPCYFPLVDLYAVVDKNAIVAFLGMSEGKIEMLFVDSDMRGCGYGSLLLDFAVSKGASLVDVNEQNPQALRFYQSKCFGIVSRDDTDSDGRPFPILHLSLDSK